MQELLTACCDMHPFQSRTVELQCMCHVTSDVCHTACCLLDMIHDLCWAKVAVSLVSCAGFETPSAHSQGCSLLFCFDPC